MRFSLRAILAVVLSTCLQAWAQAGTVNIASGAPEVGESGSWDNNPGVPADSTTYGGQHVTDGGQSTPASLGTGNPGYTPVTEAGGPGNYWLPVQNTLGYVTIDLGSAHNIGEIDLYNTHNDGANDRATQAFHIVGSNAVDVNGNPIGGSTIVSGTLPEAFGVNPIAPDIFNASGANLGSYRYLTFVVDSAYLNTFNGDSPGLNEIRVYDANAVPEPGTLALMSIGSAVLGGGYLRRRRS